MRKGRKKERKRKRKEKEKEKRKEKEKKEKGKGKEKERKRKGKVNRRGKGKKEPGMPQKAIELEANREMNKYRNLTTRAEAFTHLWKLLLGPFTENIWKSCNYYLQDNEARDNLLFLSRVFSRIFYKNGHDLAYYYWQQR